MKVSKAYRGKGYRSKMRQVVVTKAAADELNTLIFDFPDVKKGYFVSNAITNAIQRFRTERLLERKG